MLAADVAGDAWLFFEPASTIVYVDDTGDEWLQLYARPADYAGRTVIRRYE